MRKTFTFPLAGGLDEISQPLAIAPGRVIGCLNHEALEDGYGRVDGFERFDGRTGPTDFPFHMLPFEDGVTAIVAGDTVTGAASGASGVALADAELDSGAWDGAGSGRIAIRSMSGTFTVGENLQVGGVTRAVCASAALAGSAGSGDPYEEDGAQAAIAYARGLIQAVPGSGPIRGIVELNGTAYAFRNNVGGTAGAIYKSTTGGWSAVSLGHRLAFTSGGTTEITEGQTITGATSGATAVVRRVVLQSGTWAGTADAAGYFVLSGITGTFVAENLNVGASLNLATIAGAPTAITLPAGGRYNFIVHNFYAGSNTRRIYGANGVGTAFEFDGAYFVPIESGQALDTPERVAVFRNQLFLSFPNGLLQGSAVDNPVNWEVANGAWETGLGSNIVDFIAHTESLIIVCEHGIHSVTGYNKEDFVLGPITLEAGGKPYTAQRIGAGYYLDNRGLRSITTTQSYGNFAMGAITETIKKTMRRKAALGSQPTASVIVRSKSHYRLFFDDGTGISFYIGRKFPEPMVFDLGVTLVCISSAETDGVERILFGDDEGVVYQLDKGTSFDGEDIEAFVQLAYVHMGSPNLVKRCHKVAIEASAQAASAMRLSIEYDYANREQDTASQAVVTAQGTGGLWDVVNWDDFYWSGPDENVLEADVDGQGCNASILIASEADDIPAYVLRGATLYYSERGARR